MSKTLSLAVPEIQQIVTLRGSTWLVTDVQETFSELKTSGKNSPASHLVSVSSLAEDALGEELQVIWQLEPGAQVHDRLELPKVEGFDPPEQLNAFLNAIRWGASSNADKALVQAPFRSGIVTEPYQLDPLVRAIQMPRANLLIADDVGLGKTIEAGLIIQEMLFRHRIRNVLIICPASLQIQWRDQMRDKFGLDFEIVDSAKLKELRRTRGIRVNPWTHFPRLITSIDYLKRDYPLTLLREILPPNGEPTIPRRIDMLIVDEAHGVAPSSSGKYMIDSQRTRAIRMLAPHCEHKLFLTATPHNGYNQSFSALLELLDNQRFTRNVPPEPKQLEAILVRRLKSDILDFDGKPRFKGRILEDIPVAYTSAEKRIHQALNDYANFRRKRARSENEHYLIEFVLKLIKKRLFSSPEAFYNTLVKHKETLAAYQERAEELQTQLLEKRQWQFLEQELNSWEEEQEDIASDDNTSVKEVLERVAGIFGGLSQEESALLDEMQHWADKAAGKGDSKLKALLAWLETHIKPDGKWTERRVIIFTEYADTLAWLFRQLETHKFAEKERIKWLQGGMKPEEREAIKAAFQAHPDESPVRILLATDAASEGIDLQNHCHDLIHYEIPWNPNRLEQRNGRIDRHGQRFSPQIYHFVSAGFQGADLDQTASSLDGDLEFLKRVAQKIDRIRQDLGKVGPVLAKRVEKAMLGKGYYADTSQVEKEAAQTRLVAFERDMRKKIEELKDKLNESQSELEIDPQTILQVVSCGLELANQPELEVARLKDIWPSPDGRFIRCPVFHLPPLDGAWARCAEGLRHPHTGRQRPITFDPEVIQGRDDVVLVHLNHQLVQMSLRLLRAQVWSQEKRLNRVCARLVPASVTEHVSVLAFARLMVIGGKHDRLHEELITAGGVLRDGRFSRIDTEREKQNLLRQALNSEPNDEMKQRLIEYWPDIKSRMTQALEARQKDRTQGLLNKVIDKADKEATDMQAIMKELEISLKKLLGEFDEPTQLKIEYEDLDEDAQFRADLGSLRNRLNLIPNELQKELEAIRLRYDNPSTRLFPVALMWFVPTSLNR